MITSRGIPSKEAFYLPAHYSKEIRRFQDDSENLLRNFWTLEEIMNFVFPKKYQPKYHDIAVRFMSLLTQRLTLNGNDLSSFVRTNGISKATFYNRVLPRLKRIGLIKVERETVDTSRESQKRRPMRVSLSKTFGNYLTKIGESWLAIVDDARTRQRMDTGKGEE